jgi:hypothetical protein
MRRRALSGARRSKGTDAVKAPAPGNRRRRLDQQDHHASRVGTARRTPVRRAAGGSPSEWQEPTQSSPHDDAANAGLGRGAQWRLRRAGPRVGTNTACPRGTARPAGSSRREGVSGIGGGSAVSGLRPRRCEVQPTCTPGTRRHEWTLFRRNTSRGLRHSGARRWQTRGQPRGCQLRRLRQAQSALSRRHGPHRKARASARTERWGGRQRQEGNGRSDAVRLLTRGMLRRVQTALRGTAVTIRRDTAARTTGARAFGSTKQEG